MRKALIATIISMALSGTASAQEHDPMMHQMHMSAMGDDSRQLVNFPPEMRQHTLMNMRDHLTALSEILSAMSSAKYTQAAKIASQRLGMDSPSAEGCKSEGAGMAPQMSQAANMDHRMAEFMPPGMRNIGLEMHQSASAFAVEATRAARTGNAKPALAALSKVTQQCSNCHSAYKVQ